MKVELDDTTGQVMAIDYADPQGRIHHLDAEPLPWDRNTSSQWIIAHENFVYLVLRARKVRKEYRN